MNKELDQLYSMNNGGEINADDCQNINKVLANIKLDDIPIEQRENVKGYLISTLNNNSVEQSIINKFEKLLDLLQ